ncbi:MAG TPA: flagellar filament capping protein FliD [Solirubrobacteraceae bacterium]|jgi:flagellar hook-associated protein 2|nr:flagellar filament capping protein FliD [Solirubrobacteraceae bacterium]
MSTSGVSSTGSSSTTGLITPESISTSGGLTSTSTLTNTGVGGQPQIVGLGSGINTDALIQAELAEQELPLINMQDTITSLQNENSTLSSIQTVLQNVSLDAFDLGAPSLFFQSQTANSSDTNLVSAATSANLGAVIGSTTLAVTQLAGASQATFAANLGSGNTTTQADDTLTVTVGSGTAQTMDIAAGSSLSQIASDINSSSTLGVYASVLNGQVVMSSRTTGTGNTITASDSNGYFSTVSSQDGQDAEMYVNGSTTPTYSASDTVTNAIPGVTLTLEGVTPTDAPVTITTGAPAVNTQSIVQAVQQFVTDYNNAVSGIEGVINTAPASESDSSQASPYTDNLFGDPELENLLSNMRETMYTGGTGLPSGMASLEDIGISTGASTGSVQQSAVDGLLTVDTTTLTNAIETNPNGVEAVLQSWSTSFQGVANTEASPFGALYTRIQGNSTLVTSLTSQLSSQTELYNTEEANMEEQWANVEATLSTLNDQKTSLSSFTSSLSSSSSSSS